MRGNAGKSKNHRGIKGHVDSDIIFNIKKHLRKVHMIPFSQILIERRILFHAGGYKLLEPRKPRQPGRIKGLVHTPDLVVTDGLESILFVVEQDGKIHDSPVFAAKDGQRNQHYSEAGIPYVILKTSKIRSRRMSIAEFLDRELERRLGMRKPAGLHTRPPPDRGPSQTGQGGP